MRAYTLTDVDDHELVSHLKSLVVRDRGTTAEILAHIAEVDSRRLYLPAAHPSMFSVLPEGAGLLRGDGLQAHPGAARMARKYPVIFAAIADGRLHVSAVVLLSKYLRRDNADDLLRAAFHKSSKSEIVELLAERIPAGRTCRRSCGRSRRRYFRRPTVPGDSSQSLVRRVILEHGGAWGA